MGELQVDLYLKDCPCCKRPCTLKNSKYLGFELKRYWFNCLECHSTFIVQKNPFETFGPAPSSSRSLSLLQAEKVLVLAERALPDVAQRPYGQLQQNPRRLLRSSFLHLPMGIFLKQALAYLKATVLWLFFASSIVLSATYLVVVAWLLLDRCLPHKKSKHLAFLIMAFALAYKGNAHKILAAPFMVPYIVVSALLEEK